MNSTIIFIMNKDKAYSYTYTKKDFNQKANLLFEVLTTNHLNEEEIKDILKENHISEELFNQYIKNKENNS